MRTQTRLPLDIQVTPKKLEQITKEFPEFTLPLLEEALRDWKSRWFPYPKMVTSWPGLCSYFNKVHGIEYDRISSWLYDLGVIGPSPWAGPAYQPQLRVAILEQLIQLYQQHENKN